MDERTFQTLELEALLALLARHVGTPLGRREALRLRPSTDRAAIEASLELVTECAGYLAESGGFGLSGLDDPEPALAALAVAGTSLEPLQIALLERLIGAAVSLRAPFRDPQRAARYPRLAALATRPPELARLLANV